MEDNTLYILIGCTIDPRDQKYQIEKYFKSGVGVSSSEYERKLTKGFEESQKDYCFISAPACGTWPFSSKRIIVKGFHKTDRIKPVKYNCSIFIRNISKQRAINKEIKKIVSDNYKKRYIHFIVCELHKPYLNCLKKIKKKYKDGFSTIIAMDLPEFTNSKSTIKKYFKRNEQKKLLDNANKYGDSYVCLTKDLATLFISNKPVILSEGIIERKDSRVDTKTKNEKPHCLLLGSVLGKGNGIEIIYETAKLMPDVIFDICGNVVFDISLLSQVNNIRYHGFVSQEEAEDYIENSDIVLSPRIPNGEKYLSYSFPSKIFSYIAHMKPIITYMIPCYEGTIFEKTFVFPTDITPESMVQAIRNVIDNGFVIPQKLYIDIIKKYSSKSLVNQIASLRTASL